MQTERFEGEERASASIRVDKGIAALVSLCHGDSAARGWWNDPLPNDALVPQKLMLIVSELSEAMEAHRKGLQDDHLPHRPGFEVELADAVIRIADLAGAMGLDLGDAILEKIAYNRRRVDHDPEVREGAHGKRY